MSEPKIVMPEGDINNVDYYFALFEEGGDITCEDAPSLNLCGGGIHCGQCALSSKHNFNRWLNDE